MVHLRHAEENPTDDKVQTHFIKDTINWQRQNSPLAL